MKKISLFRFVVATLTSVISIYSFNNVSAQEITAINFQGEILGKVISDGKVVSMENKVLGNVTADSFILDNKGNIIGGVVPQGVAIGNDAKVLGKVSGDGIIRSAAGQIMGKALPSGLVVNDYFDIVGQIIFPGLVYDDEGKIAGRVTGDGSYSDLSGKQKGIITPDGYAYRKENKDYILDGRLISSRMVISTGGNFIGSVVPGGQVTDFNSEVLGYIKANEYVYDNQNSIIGKLVNTGYAINENGEELGIVSYNGVVIKEGKSIGKIRADGRIVGNTGSVIGSELPFTGVAADMQGNYLGYMNVNGQIAKGSSVIGKVGSRGFVFDKDGDVKGKIVKTGPIYNYQGEQVGHAVSNGSVINLDGTTIGYMIGETAYNLSGEIIGNVLNNQIIFTNTGSYVGMCGISSQFNYKGDKLKISPLGYVWNSKGDIIGRTLHNSSFYTAAGTLYAYMNLSGQALRADGGDTEKIIGNGMTLNIQDNITAQTINIQTAVNYEGIMVGVPNQHNALLNKNMKQIGKVLPDSSVSSFGGTNYMPKIGQAYQENIAVKFNGDFLGHIDVSGNVIGHDGVKVGYLVERGLVSNNGGSIVGMVINYSGASNDKCELLGVTTQQGTVFNARGVFVGKILGDNSVIGSSGIVLGKMSRQLPLINFSGKIIGYSDYQGIAYNLKGERLGCIDSQGRLYDASKEWIGGLVSYDSFIDFNGKIKGFALFDGTIIDDKNSISAYQQPDGNINSNSGIPQGMLMHYKVAFDLNNRFMGYVDSQGKVLDSRHKGIGRVDFDGNVYSGKDLMGYALNNMYVYGNNGQVLGVISPSGEVADFNNHNLGMLDKGFVIANNEVIARGERDYNIRDNQKLVLGELLFNGNVINKKGKVIGSINNEGQVIDSAGSVIAQATPLQYYRKSLIKPSPSSHQDKSREVEAIVNNMGETIGYISEGGVLINNQGKVVGQINADNEVTNEQGKKIGKINEQGNVINEQGEVVGRKESVETLLPTIPMVETIVDNTGSTIGYITPQGDVVNDKGESIGEIMQDGKFIDLQGEEIGRINSQNQLVDSTGKVIGLKSRVVTSLPVSREAEAIVDNMGETLGYISEEGILINNQGEVVGQINADNQVTNEYGEKIGKINEQGNVINEQGEVIGRKESIETLLPTIPMVETIVDASGKKIGHVTSKGIIIDEQGQVTGKIDSSGKVTDEQGSTIGQLNQRNEIVDGQGKVVARKNKTKTTLSAAKGIGALFDKLGKLIGYLTPDGKLIDEDMEVLGEVSSDGKIISADGEMVGRINSRNEIVDNQGKKIGRKGRISANSKIMKMIQQSQNQSNPIDPFTIPVKPQENISDIIITGDDYIKSLNIALTSDGKFLGDILPSGEVKDDNDKVVGYLMPDNTVIDGNGNTIGVKQSSGEDTKPIVEKPSGEVFIPSVPNAYRNDAVPNIGPGGGTGPGERYDPVRRAALNRAMQQRRANIRPGSVKSKINESSFTGYEKLNTTKSTWKIDLSNIILSGKPIPAVIARAIDTNHPAPVVAYVERNVYAEEGRNVIIPAGSRVQGQFGSISGPTEATSNSARVQISWNRLIRPDGSMFDLGGASTADAQGRIGALGYVDQQLLKKYTLPALTTVLSSTAAYVMATDDNSSGSVETSKQESANDARRNFLDNMQNIFDQILTDKTNVKAVTYVPNGTRIIIYTQRDLEIRTPDNANEENNEDGNFHGLIDKDVTQTSANVPPGTKTYGPGGPSSTLSGDTGGQVVYNPDSLNLKPSGTTPLISNGTSAKRTPPPPPPMYGANNNSQNTETGNTNSSNNDNSVPALF